MSSEQEGEAFRVRIIGNSIIIPKQCVFCNGASSDLGIWRIGGGAEYRTPVGTEYHSYSWEFFACESCSEDI